MPARIFPDWPSSKDCPDKDGDGVPDQEDKCPDVAGLARYQGCPILIRMEMASTMRSINVPMKKAWPATMAVLFPIRDKDGVNDEEDKCPDLPGTVANQGCPEIKRRSEEADRCSCQRISSLLPEVTSCWQNLTNPLDDVVKLLNEDPNLKLDVEGHTDNTRQGRQEPYPERKTRKAVA